MRTLSRRSGVTSRKRVRIVVTVLAAVVAVQWSPWAGTAQAAGAGIRSAAMAVTPEPPPSLRSWYGKVVKVRDGDTVEVDITGDGTSRPVPIRNIGIQAMALGECHGREAKARLTKLTLGKQVRTQSYYTTRDQHGRFQRYIDVYNPATRQYDIDSQQVLLREGHALWLPQHPESARNLVFHTYAEQGIAAGRNLYDTDYCAPGPAQSVPIKMWLNWDADGVDTENVNGEWVRVKNTGTSPLPLAGFSLRKGGGLPTVDFPSSLVLGPGEVLTVHMGTGTATRLDYYWGGTRPSFSLSPPTTPGQAMYLVDSHGDIRAQAMYPCTYQCSDPAAGRLALTEVVNDAPGDDAVTFAAEDGELATVTNTSSGPVDLTSYVLDARGDTFEFPNGFELAAGTSVVVHVGPGTEHTDVSGTRHLYWGHSYATLGEAGGWLELRAWNGFRIDCAQWGTEACPPPR